MKNTVRAALVAALWLGNAVAFAAPPSTGNTAPASHMRPEVQAPSGGWNPWPIDSSGYPEVNCITGCSGGGGGGNAAASATGSSVPTSADYLGINVGGNLVGVSGSNPVPVSGAFFQATQPVSEINLDAMVAPVAPAAATATKMIMLGCAYNSSQPAFTSGYQGAVQCDATGQLYIHPNGGTQAATIVASASSGFSQTRAINAASSAMATSIKTSAGQVYSWIVSNGGSGTVYFRLYNLAAAPTVGSATGIVATIPVAAGGTAIYSTDVGIVMGTGIAYDVTAGSFADSDTTTITTASTVSVTIFSK